MSTSRENPTNWSIPAIAHSLTSISKSVSMSGPPFLNWKRSATSRNGLRHSRLKVIPALADPTDEEEDFDEFEDEDDEYGTEAEIMPRASDKHIPLKASNSWKHLLAKVNPPRIARPPQTSWPTSREILYVIENARRSTGGTLALQIDFREPRKNGGWKKPRPLSLSHEMLADLPDPADREILTRLIGVPRETWYYGPYESIYRFQPEGREFEALLPPMSRTGRLYFRSPQIEELRQLTWDDAGPWEFRIDVHRDTAGRQYEVRGSFHRAGDRMDISKPEHIYPEGILLDSTLIARYHGSHDWVSFFRREESFFVPEDEADQWLETMIGLRSVPPITLPEELRLQEMEPDPRRIARIRTRKEMWGAPFLLGEIFFDYLGHVIGEDEPATGIPLVSQRQKILRNSKTEDLASDSKKSGPNAASGPSQRDELRVKSDESRVKMGAKEVFPKDPVSQNSTAPAVVGYRSLLPQVPVSLPPDCLKLQISDHAPGKQIDRVLRKAPPSPDFPASWEEVST